MGISVELRNQVTMADDFTCVYCGYRGPDVVVDHFIARVHGGPDVFDNLMTACTRCNNWKLDYPIQERGMVLTYGRFAQTGATPGRPKKTRSPVIVIDPYQNSDAIEGVKLLASNGFTRERIYGMKFAAFPSKPEARRLFVDWVLDSV